jgi:hypothetical protein
MSNFNNYELCAIVSVQNNSVLLNPMESFDKSARDIFPTKSSQEKACPKSTFLGLCAFFSNLKNGF